MGMRFYTFKLDRIGLWVIYNKKNKYNAAISKGKCIGREKKRS